MIDETTPITTTATDSTGSADSLSAPAGTADILSAPTPDASASASTAPAPGLTTGMGALMLEAGVVEILRTIFDPEIPVNIYDLGLVYAVIVDPSTNEVLVKMTLTSPTCPVAGTLPGEVEQKIATVPGVSKSTVELVWDPPWDPSVMSDEAKLLLNLW